MLDTEGLVDIDLFERMNYVNQMYFVDHSQEMASKDPRWAAAWARIATLMVATKLEEGL